MDFKFWLFAGMLMAVCWWLGYAATKRYRRNKHKQANED